VKRERVERSIDDLFKDQTHADSSGSILPAKPCSKTEKGKSMPAPSLWITPGEKARDCRFGEP